MLIEVIHAIDRFEVGLSKIPKSSAAYLVSKTLPLPGDPDNYIIGLQVFHSLHCLVCYAGILALLM